MNDAGYDDPVGEFPQSTVSQDAAPATTPAVADYRQGDAVAGTPAPHFGNAAGESMLALRTEAAENG